MSSTYQQLEFINEFLRTIAEMLDNLSNREGQGLTWFEMDGARGAAADVSSAIVDIQHILSSMEERER